MRGVSLCWSHLPGASAYPGRLFCRAWTFSCRAGGATLADEVRILKLALNSGAACGPHRHDYHFSEALRAAASSHLRASGLRWAVSARVVVFVIYSAGRPWRGCAFSNDRSDIDIKLRATVRLRWSDAHDPNATQTGLKSRSAAASCCTRVCYPLGRHRRPGAPRFSST